MGLSNTEEKQKAGVVGPWMPTVRGCVAKREKEREEGKGKRGRRKEMRAEAERTRTREMYKRNRGGGEVPHVI